MVETRAKSRMNIGLICLVTRSPITWLFVSTRCFNKRPPYLSNKIFFWQEQELLNKSHPVLSRIKCQKFTVSSQFVPKRLLCDVWCECVSACMFVFSFQRVCISSSKWANAHQMSDQKPQNDRVDSFCYEAPKGCPKDEHSEPENNPNHTTSS